MRNFRYEQGKKVEVEDGTIEEEFLRNASSMMKVLEGFEMKRNVHIELHPNGDCEVWSTDGRINCGITVIGDTEYWWTKA